MPEGIVLHHDGIPPNERTWFGPLPVTTPARTLNDCARAALSPELLEQAAREGLDRGLFTRKQIPDVRSALEPFGGLRP